MKIIIILLALMLTACATNSSVFTEFMDKDKVCNLVNDELVKTFFNVNGGIEKTGKFSDSLFNGFIGNNCDISWDADEGQNNFSLTLIPLKPNEVFPPIVLSEKQLQDKVVKAQKSAFTTLKGKGQSIIDAVLEPLEDNIRDNNNYKLINGIEDSAILRKLTIKSPYIKTHSVFKLTTLSGNIKLEFILSTDEKAINLAKAIINNIK